MKIILLILVILASFFTLSGCNMPSPDWYPNTVWVCEEPYMWFEVRKDELGTFGFGQAKDENDEIIELRFFTNQGNCLVYRESDFWVTDTNGEIHMDDPSVPPILRGKYKMRKNDTVMKVDISLYTDEDQLYHGKYETLKFYRQELSDVQE